MDRARNDRGNQIWATYEGYDTTLLLYLVVIETLLLLDNIKFWWYLFRYLMYEKKQEKRTKTRIVIKYSHVFCS